MEDSETISINLWNSYITEFNEQFRKNRFNKSLNINASLARSLALTNSVQNVEFFNPNFSMQSNTVSVTQFYINIHKLLSIPDLEDDLMWSCVSILQLASKNLEARKALITKFRFFPLLAKMLTKLNLKEKTEKFLELMQDFSFGINITWEEPYLPELIETLIEYISSENIEIAQYSMLILINICHQNFAAIRTLIRTVNISKLCEKTKKFGVLANKLILILEKNNCIMDREDVECLVMKCFIDFELAIQKLNKPLLQHIVHFLEEIKDNKQYLSTIDKFSQLEEELEKTLKIIKIQFNNTKNGCSYGNETQRNFDLSLSLSLKFLTLIIDIAFLLKQKNGFEISNNILIEMFDLCRIWCVNEQQRINALQLLKSLIEFANDELLLEMLDKFTIFPKLIAASENNEHPSEFTTAMQKLLLVLLKRQKTENFIFSLITDSYFNKILSPLLTEKKESQNCFVYSLADLSKYLYCFLILIEFSKKAESTWKSKVDNFFNFYQIKYILAKGLLCDDSDLSELVFDISKVDGFPKNEVAKFMAELNKNVPTKAPQQMLVQDSTNADLFFERNRLIFSKDFEHKLNATLSKFSNFKQDFDNIATSELIELYTCKIDMAESKLHDLENNLENANQRITNLTHDNSLLTVSLSKHTDINFQMNLLHERFVNENKDLKKQRDIFKNTADDLGKKFKDKSESLKRHLKVHEVKYAEKLDENKAMREELNKLKALRDDYLNKIEVLTQQTEEYSAKIESMKKSIHLLEEKCEKNELSIAEKEKEILKLNKNIEDSKKSQTMHENIIKNLENQIKDKNDTIKQLEAEINEVEDMRKTIMSLMESKKPKRKA